MNKAKQRQITLQEMRRIFYPNMLNRVDWMGYLITEDNKPSYHHIVKREELAEANQPIDATVDNGAYLGKRSHEILHQIELIDHDLFLCWNDLFLMINRMRRYPIDDVWDMVFHLQDLTIERIMEYNSSKKLIKSAN